MPIRSQTYLWDAGKSTTTAGTTATAVNTSEEGQTIDCFSGSNGNRNTSSQTQKRNTFIVLEEVAITPTYYTCGVRSKANPNPTFRGLPIENGVAGPRAYFQPRVDDTAYFVSPDGTQSIGMPGTAIPFPAQPQAQSSLKPPLFRSSDKDGGLGKQGTPPFNIYVRRGQTWDVGVVFTNGGAYKNAVSTSSAQTNLADNTLQIENNLGFQIQGVNS